MATPPDVIAGEVIEVEWGNAVRDWAAFGEVDASVEVASFSATTTESDAASVNLSIPVDWVSWNCMAYATMSINDPTSGTATGFVLIRIDGTNQALQNVQTAASPAFTSVTVAGRRTGLTTTGSRAVSLRVDETGTDLVLTSIFLYARAIRTS